MEEKKVLSIDTMICDLRTVSEETLQSYDKIYISAMTVFITERTQELFHRYPVDLDAMAVEKLDENATNAICSLKIEYTQDGETVKVSMGFYTQGKKKVQFSAFKDEKAGKIAIDPSSITKVSIGMGKNKKVDINNIVLVAKK